ncbi:hypothetical protein BpHYR1_006220 [Brachionus plicatilis]|uniref:Uncharacterized protein n=1 Tax=Brachionus plicatilis TaxID=10195 RepID=A0A3M7S870_BRAPC|nr:hypothetical protein BpHYR1_006220 [Brachionus plicatilis]
MMVRNDPPIYSQNNNIPIVVGTQQGHTVQLKVLTCFFKIFVTSQSPDLHLTCGFYTTLVKCLNLIFKILLNFDISNKSNIKANRKYRLSKWVYSVEIDKKQPGITALVKKKAADSKQ